MALNDDIFMITFDDVEDDEGTFNYFIVIKCKY